MLAVKCLLVLDSFYVTMKDTVVSFDAIVYSKQKIGTKKCLQTFYASTREGLRFQIQFTSEGSDEQQDLEFFCQ